MKTATYIILILTLTLFAISAYYAFVSVNSAMHHRFMGLATASIIVLLMPCFLIWRYREKNKARKKK